ncbi:hypothetical protein Tco_0399493, partial [Tanacetum coccineum]
AAKFGFTGRKARARSNLRGQDQNELDPETLFIAAMMQVMMRPEENSDQSGKDLIKSRKC